MGIRGDERAVAVQVGAILLLGFVLISFSVYQASVVPQETKQRELEHSRTIDRQFSEVRSSIVETGRTGRGSPTSISLGVRYRPRPIFVNPPPASGSLTTERVQSPNSTVTLGNASALDPETGDYWNSTTHNLVTNRLAFEPSYNSLPNPPTFTYENTVTYAGVGDERVTRSGQLLVEGNRISAIILTGNVSQNGVDTTALEARPVGTTTRTVRVDNPASDRLNLTVPSRLGVGTWRNLLNRQSVSGNVYRVRQSSTGKISILMDNAGVADAPAFYVVELVRVHVGDEPAGQIPTYLTDVSGTTREVVQGSTTPLTVEVRDRYDEPVSGVRVNATATAGTVVSPKTVTSDEDGRASFTYRVDPGQTATGTVNVSFDESPLPAKNVTFEVTPVTGGSTTIDDGTGDSLEWSTEVDWDSGSDRSVTHAGVSDDRSGTTVELGSPNTSRAERGLVGYWPLDADSGTIAEDATGHNDGIIRDVSTSGNSVQLNAEGTLDASSFDFTPDGGTDKGAYVALGTGTTPHLAGQPFTWAAWIRTTTGDKDIIVGTNPPSNANGFLWYLDNGRVEAYDRNGYVGVESDVAVDDGVWHHVAVTIAADGSGQYFVDGYLNGTFTNDTVAIQTNDRIHIGQENDTSDFGFGPGTSDFFDGNIDEVRMYNRTLSQGEIGALYNGSNPAGGERWNGSHVSAYKQFDSVSDPTGLTLSTTATRPAGTDVTVYVESDPDTDGTFEEQSDHIVLDGSSSYTVSGLSSRSARFRLRVVANTTDVTAGPTLSEVVLQR